MRATKIYRKDLCANFIIEKSTDFISMLLFSTNLLFSSCELLKINLQEFSFGFRKVGESHFLISYQKF